MREVEGEELFATSASEVGLVVSIDPFVASWLTGVVYPDNETLLGKVPDVTVGSGETKVGQRFAGACVDFGGSQGASRGANKLENGVSLSGASFH